MIMNIDNYLNKNTMNLIESMYSYYNGNRFIKGQPEVELNKTGKYPAVFTYTNTSEGKLINEDLIAEADEIYIFHHNDLDGEASASLMYNYVADIKEGNVRNVNLFKYNYKKPLLDEYLNKLSENFNNTKLKRVAIAVDLAFPIEDITRIREMFDYTIWVDHHETSCRMIKDFYGMIFKEDKPISIDINSKVSSTFVCYFLVCDTYFNLRNNYVKSKVLRTSLGSLLVSDYDTWNTINIVRYNLGLYMNEYYFNMNNLSPDHPFWEKVLLKNPDTNLSQILNFGEKFFNIKQLETDVFFNAEMRYVFDTNIEGTHVRMVAMNASGNSNKFPDPLDRNSIKCLIRILPEKELMVSLYTENPLIREFSLGKFCKEHFNGGGHAGAAGFSITKEEFYINTSSSGYANFVKSKDMHTEGCDLRYNGTIADIANRLFITLHEDLEDFIIGK